MTASVVFQACAQDRATVRSNKAPAVLPAFEIVTIVRSAGLSPTSKPTRRGANYSLRALDTNGQEVRVTVDARAGEIVAVTPVAYRGRSIDPLHGPSVYDSGPPVYEAGPPIYRRNAPVVILEDDQVPPTYRRAAPVAPPMPSANIVPPERDAVIIPSPTPPEVIMTPQPMPRQVIVNPPPPASIVPPAPIPNVPPSSAMTEPQTDGDENVQLPPPPPRFQQRVNLTPAPKPTPKPAKPNTKTNAKADSKTDVTKSIPAKPSASGANKSDTKPDSEKLNSSSATQPAAPSNAPPAPLQLHD